MLSFATIWNVTLAKLMSVLYMFLSVVLGGGIFNAKMPEAPDFRIKTEKKMYCRIYDDLFF